MDVVCGKWNCKCILKQEDEDMIKVYSNIIPAAGFKAMTIWPFLFVRKKAVQNGLFNEVDERHEEIHGEQQKEMLFIGFMLAAVMAVTNFGWWSLLALPLFFWWYGIEWFIKACYYGNATTAYKNISFEREAYAHQHQLDYLFYRNPFAWFRYIK